MSAAAAAPDAGRTAGRQQERGAGARGGCSVHGHSGRDCGQCRVADDQVDVGFSEQSLSWILNAYTLIFGGFLLLGGRAADRLGRRRLFMAGIALFAAASLVCGLSQSEGMLLVARGFQGLGGAMVSPAALSIILTTFAEGPERNRALAVWGAIAGAGGAVGLLLGGMLVQC